MNNIKAIAKVGEHVIKLDYVYAGEIYTIEVPRTMNNGNMKDGEMVQVLLGVMPVENENVFKSPTLDEYDV
tara:strand:+ start:6674 stop:6886 length:213 start_codon:yes stop_codon:yes gene_type:complete